MYSFEELYILTKRAVGTCYRVSGRTKNVLERVVFASDEVQFLNVGIQYRSITKNHRVYLRIEAFFWKREILFAK